MRDMIDWRDIDITFTQEYLKTEHVRTSANEEPEPYISEYQLDLADRWSVVILTSVAVSI